MHFVLSITSLVAVLAAEPQPPKLALYDAWGSLQYTTGKVGDDYQETSHSLKQGEGLTWGDGDATKEYLYHFTVKAEGEEERTPETWFVDGAATKFEKDRSMQPINVEIDTAWKGGIAIKFKKQKAKTDARARTEFELIELPSMMVVKGCEISLTPESAIIKIPVQGKTEERRVIKNEDVIKIGTNCYQYEHGTHQWFPVDCEHFVKKGGAPVTSDDIKQLINAVMHDICGYTISKGKFGRKLLITTPCIEKEEAMRLALDDWSKELDELIDLIRSKDRSKTSRIPDKKSIVSQKIERFVSLKKAYGGVIEAMPSSKQSTFKDKLTMLIAKSCKMTEDKIRSTLSDYDVASRDWLADVKQGTPKKDRKPKKELLYELRSATSGYIQQYRVFIEASVPGDQAEPFETELSNLDTEFKAKKKKYSKELRDFQAAKAKEQYFDVYDTDEADGDIREYAYGGPYQSQRSKVPCKSDEQALHQPLHKGEYQIEGFTPFFQSVMNAARKYDAKNMLQELYRKGYSEECLADICVGFEQEPHWNLDALNETTPTTIVEKTKKKPSKEYYPYPCRLCSKKYKTLKGYTNHMAKQHATNDKTDDDDDDEYRLQINENGSTKRVQKKQTVQNGSKKRKYSGRKLIKS